MSKTRKTSKTSKTRKNIHWEGWRKERPEYHERTVMLRKCGKKCFLGTKRSFPICKKNTCKVSKKGVYAAYIRSREYRNKSDKYRKISVKAHNLLTKM